MAVEATRTRRRLDRGVQTEESFLGRKNVGRACVLQVRVVGIDQWKEKRLRWSFPNSNDSQVYGNRPHDPYVFVLVDDARQFITFRELPDVPNGFITQLIDTEKEKGRWSWVKGNITGPPSFFSQYFFFTLLFKFFWDPF